ncbi:hypothetical protein G6O67_005159 [Ophiocordyceps sinensis]|uniref:N-acetyltransferase domain-containing protein n=1 Tax=Ophiocordyceps sinensis TaxID=72228 RepID=A0A8H4PR08_9HYPO|nr:hypothetical protein G6O67_005159 [Ophiocordyceps sinensis]
MNIRPATSADVPAVARLVLAALADEAPWNSFCPSKALTGGSGCIEFAEAMLRSHLDSQRHRVMVLELSAPKSGTRSGPPIVVSVAVWDTDACRSATERDGPAGRLHENGSHSVFAKMQDKLAALGRACCAGKQTSFAGRGPFLHLDILATRPDYQRHGYAKALVSWGTDYARKTQRPLCVQAASRAYILFSGLEFVDLGPVPLPSDQQNEAAVLKAMMFEPGKCRRRDLMVSVFSRSSPRRV